MDIEKDCKDEVKKAWTGDDKPQTTSTHTSEVKLIALSKQIRLMPTATNNLTKV